MRHDPLASRGWRAVLLMLLALLLLSIVPAGSFVWRTTTSLSSSHHRRPASPPGPPSSPPLRGSSQSLDYTSLCLTVDELRAVFVPGKVENVIQENEFNVFLGVKTQTGANRWLQFCWHPSTARIGAGDAPPRGETTPYSFASTLRTFLKSLTITKLSVPRRGDCDRIVEVELSERLSDAVPKWRLVLEVMGSRSNLVLVSPVDNTIQAVAYQVSTTTTVRPLQTTGVYVPPPSGGGIFSPVKDVGGVWHVVDHAAFAAKLTELPQLTVERALVAVYRGMSPNVARCVLRAANIDAHQPAHTLPADELRRLYAYFAAWAALFADAPPADATVVAVRGAHYHAHDAGKHAMEYVPLSFAPAHATADAAHAGHGSPPAHAPAPAGAGARAAGSDVTTSPTSVSAFLQRYYTSYERRTEFAALVATCARKLAYRRKKAAKLWDMFTAQMAEASGGRADALHAEGDLVTSFTHAWEDKSPVLQCYDFVTGAPVTVNIPYGSTPSEHAQRLYKKAKKLKRSIATLDGLLAKVGQHLAYLGEVEAAWAGLQEQGYRSFEDILALRDIDEELDELDDRTVVQLGQAASEDAGDRDKDDGGEGKGHAAAKGGKAPKGVKKSKDTGGTAAGGKGKQKPSATAKKNASGAATPAAANKKKVLQGLLVLRPGGTGGGSWAAAAAPESSADDGASDGAATMPPLVVGRSSRQNDRVSFEVAKEHHLWFHVQGSPGSHCLLQLDPGAKGRATEESLQFAADVAAYYSQARGSTQVPVGYTSPKYVRRVSGGAPGMVSVLQQQGVVYGSPARGKEWVERLGPPAP